MGALHSSSTRSNRVHDKAAHLVPLLASTSTHDGTPVRNLVHNHPQRTTRGFIAFTLSPTFMTAVGSEVSFEELSLSSASEAQRFAGSIRFRELIESALLSLTVDHDETCDFHVHQVFATSEPPFQVAVEGVLRNSHGACLKTIHDFKRQVNDRLSSITWDVLRGTIRYHVHPGSIVVHDCA